MFQKDFFLFVFGVLSLTLTTIIWKARSETELNFTRRCFRAFGFLKTVGTIFAFVYVKTRDSNNTHWIQNIVTAVSFTVLAEYACRGLAEHGIERSIMLSARISLFFLAACNTFTLNQDNNLSQCLLYYVDFLLWTGAPLLAEIVSFEVQCVLDIFDSRNLFGNFVLLFPYKSLSASFFSVKFLYLCTQFARMILDENNSFNVQTTNSLLAKFNLRERISESNTLSRYIKALKLTQTFKGVTTCASGGALYMFTTVSVATDCFENAPKTNALLSHLKRQFSFLEMSATA